MKKNNSRIYYQGITEYETSSWRSSLHNVSTDVLATCFSKLKKAFGFISKKAETDFANEQIKVLCVKCRGPKQKLTELSGGNKQKVVFSKWIGRGSDILILDCATRGIDVGVKAAIYALLEDMKKQGKSIILISEELAEMIGMSDRMIVMKEGSVSAEFKRSKDLREEDIIKYMIGSVNANEAAN